MESRFEALHASGLTELVGREEELELLCALVKGKDRRRPSSAPVRRGGHRQIAAHCGVTGTPRGRAPHAPALFLLAAAHRQRLYPIIGQMERAAGFVHDDIPQARLDKLDVMLAQTSTSKQDVALFAEMLSLPHDGRYPTFELTSEQRRQKTLGALVSQMEALSRQNPVLMIFEDAHWTDPTSLELFGRIVDRIPSLRALLIVTFRPEFEPPWIGRPYVTALTINRLAQRDIEVMIDRVVGNKFSASQHSPRHHRAH